MPKAIFYLLKGDYKGSPHPQCPMQRSLHFHSLIMHLARKGTPHVRFIGFKGNPTLTLPPLTD